MAKDTGIVNIHGKQYQTVAFRVGKFREIHPEHSLVTDVLIRDEDCVVMKATILDPNGRVLATGHSEEYRKSSQINKTSALENAETSAIGRALAALGIGGTEFASADEVANAINQQKEPHPASGAGTKKAAYDSLENEDQVWVDNLANEVSLLHKEGAGVDALIKHIKKNIPDVIFNPDGTEIKDYDPHIWKMALYWKLDSKVRTAIDTIQKNLKTAA